MLRQKSHVLVSFILPIMILGGCSGTYIPQIQEVWEGVDVNGDMEFRIKQNIFCETVRALKFVRKNITLNGQPSIPDNYGVQMQISLTVEEARALNPSASFNDILPNAIRNHITVPQSFTLSGSAALSRTATRTDTSYSYYNVGRIAGEGKNKWCDAAQNLDGSSPLLNFDLGIQDYLRGAVSGAAVFQSSAPAKGGVGKSAKLDVYSYEIKFVVVTSASVTPSWKLVNVSAGTSPLVNGGRTRTHDLTLTFGPGTDAPSLAAQQAHFNGQLVQSNQQRTQPIQ